MKGKGITNKYKAGKANSSENVFLCGSFVLTS